MFYILTNLKIQYGIVSEVLANSQAQCWDRGIFCLNMHLESRSYWKEKPPEAWLVSQLFNPPRIISNRSSATETEVEQFDPCSQLQRHEWNTAAYMYSLETDRSSTESHSHLEVSCEWHSDVSWRTPWHESCVTGGLQAKDKFPPPWHNLVRSDWAIFWCAVFIASILCRHSTVWHFGTSWRMKTCTIQWNPSYSRLDRNINEKC